MFRVRGARVKGTVAPATAATATPPRPVLDVDGRRYQLTGAVTVLGRGSEADIVVDDPGVSRRHAEIRLDGGGAALRDLGSTNGTFVDGERASAARLRRRQHDHHRTHPHPVRLAVGAHRGRRVSGRESS